MALELFAHPLSSYCWKALIALYENGTPFDYRPLGPQHPDNIRRLREIWPMAKFPVLVDDGIVVAETSIIIEHLALRHPGAVRLIPDDPAAALEVRFMDRVFDNHVMGQMQRVVADAIRPPERRDAVEVGQAKAALDIAYDWLERQMADRIWAAGSDFTLADCAAAPALFYADWVHEIGERPVLAAYRARLLARPSVARAVDEARPYRGMFPLGAPDRD